MDKEQKAIERLREASFHSERLYQAPLLVTTSGGKDSDLCLELAQRAGIPFEAVHNHTTADAPETVYHIRETFRRLEEKGIMVIPFEQLDENQAWQTPVDQTGHHQNYGG